MAGDSVKYLIIGGGVASVSAAKGIRSRDKDGRVMLVTANTLMPYDRPPLSKGFLSHPDMTHDDISCKYDVWYTDNNIEVQLNTVIDRIDRKESKAVTHLGDDIAYEKLLLATGSTPKNLPGDGCHTLRRIEDGIEIRSAIEGAKSVIVIGSGFLGPEVAAQCVGMGKDTTIVFRAGHIWDRFASPALGAFLNYYYRSKGATLLPNEEIIAAGQREVQLKSGETLQADFVLSAVGVDLNTELAREAGLSIAGDDAIEVDDKLQTTTDPNIYAAGDVAHFLDPVLGKKVHHEHHLNAQWQGEAAGANMAGANEPYKKVPYFFSDFFDLHMILRGETSDPSHTKLFGEMAGGEFIELYGDENGTLKMGIAISREEKKLDPISDKLEELIESGATVESVKF